MTEVLRHQSSLITTTHLGPNKFRPNCPYSAFMEYVVNGINQPQVFFLKPLSLGDVAPPPVPCVQTVKKKNPAIMRYECKLLC